MYLDILIQLTSLRWSTLANTGTKDYVIVAVCIAANLIHLCELEVSLNYNSIGYVHQIVFA